MAGRGTRTLRAFALLVILLGTAACGTAPIAPASASYSSPAPKSKPPVVYVALGASDATGYGAANPNTQGYVPILISRLPKGSEALNLGVNGYKVHDALTVSLPQALAIQPTLITVWLVGNDFRQCTPMREYATDLDNLLGQLQSRTHATVFVANAPDFSQLPYFQEGAPGGGACVRGASIQQVQALTDQWNQTIDPIIARHGDTLVDLSRFGLGDHPDYIALDGFHPSTAGYAVLANLFWAQITADHAVPNA